VHDYLAQTDRLPDWADPGLIAAGGRMFEEHGPKLMLICPSTHCRSITWITRALRSLPSPHEC
jgi:hypothetical protein